MKKRSGQTKVSIPYELLFELYITRKLSLVEIRKIIGYCPLTIKYELIRNQIPMRSLKESHRKSQTQETKAKLSLIRKGKKNPMFGVAAPNRGIKHTKETKDKISKSLIGMFAGEKNPAYKLPQERKKKLYCQIRRRKEYKEWRLSCLKRDNFTCQICQTEKSSLIKVEVDHVVPLALVVANNNITIQNVDEKIKTCVELWDINNGRTLCKDCHQQTDTYGFKMQKLLKEKQHV